VLPSIVAANGRDVVRSSSDSKQIVSAQTIRIRLSQSERQKIQPHLTDTRIALLNVHSALTAGCVRSGETRILPVGAVLRNGRLAPAHCNCQSTFRDYLTCLLSYGLSSKHLNINLQTQQTPNPEAQEPDATPPLLEHSADVRHVPL
jgi:hypothetical protein